MRLLVLYATVVLSLGAQHEKEGEKSKHPFIGDPAAIAAGRSLFVSGCGACHGAEGQGGRGPSLRERVMWHPLEDEVLFQTIQKGIPAGGMPGSNLPEEKAWQLVAFVRSLTAPAIENNLAGDARAGEEVFWSKATGCGNCHRIRGRGGLLGPDLSNVASTRSAPDIHDAIAEPDKIVTPGYQGITLLLKGGAKLQGVARNRSNYSVQVQDAKGELHMVPMSDVSELVLSRSSLMPKDYAKRLSQTEMQNLMAFLGRQSVRADAVAKR